MKIFYMDCETTGTDCKKHGMWQFSGIVEIDGEKKEYINLFIRPFPADIIEDQAIALNNLTRAQLTSDPKFELPAIAHRKIVGLFDKYVDRFDKLDKFHVVGYNVRFDMDFCREFFYKNGDKYFGSYVWNPPLDVMNMAAVKLMGEREKLENFKLATVVKYLGIKVDETRLHDSSYDIELTMLAFKKLLGKS